MNIVHCFFTIKCLYHRGITIAHDLQYRRLLSARPDIPKYLNLVIITSKASMKFKLNKTPQALSHISSSEEIRKISDLHIE